VAVSLPIALSFLQYADGRWRPLLVTLLLLIQRVVDYFIEPRLVGHKLGLIPLPRDAEPAPGRWACGGANAEGNQDRPQDHRPVPAPGPRGAEGLRSGLGADGAADGVRQGGGQERAQAILAKNIEDLGAARELLWASDT
jgi:hypothetical protein